MSRRHPARRLGDLLVGTALFVCVGCGGGGNPAEGYSGEERRAIEKADEILDVVYGIEAEKVFSISSPPDSGIWSIQFESSAGLSCVYLDESLRLIEGSKTPDCG